MKNISGLNMVGLIVFALFLAPIVIDGWPFLLSMGLVNDFT